MNHTFIYNKLISDVILIKTQIYEDHRGTLYETYNKELFVKNGIPEIVQEKTVGWLGENYKPKYSEYSKDGTPTNLPKE
jgi:hypothetical protein